MTSEERRENRYKRRKEKREKKEYEFTIQFDDLYNVSSIDVLRNSAYKARKSSKWKTSTQKFHINLLKNCIVYSDKLNNEKSISTNKVQFTLNERGKIRNITSVGFSEKVIQKALSQNILIPILSNSLIYDNGASIENKGYDFSVNRLKEHVRSYYRSNNFNNDGWVLLIDLKNFFASIPHEILKEKIAEKIHDEKVLSLIYSIIDENKNGLPLGYETGQIEAVYYPSSVDHFIKDQKSFKYYGRYMDDSYVIHSDKEKLVDLRNDLIDEYGKLGLNLNLNKTKIIKLNDPQFKFLKNRVKLDEKGKVVIKPDKKAIKRIRVKLGKFKKMYDNNEITFEEVNNYYQSVRGFYSIKNCYYNIKEFDRLFFEYFVKDKKEEKSTNKKKPKRNIEQFNSIQDECKFSCEEIENNFYDENKLKRNKAILSINSI